MAEYAGYVAPKTVDYGAISSNILSNKLAVEQLKQSQTLAQAKMMLSQYDRQQKAQLAEEKNLREDLKGITPPESIPDKTANTFYMDGLFATKEQILELNDMKKKGIITNEDYMRSTSNLQNQWKQVADVTKQYNKNFQELTNEVASGKQSAIGVFLVGKYGNSGQFGNKVLLPSPDRRGRLEQYTIDKDGNKVKDETVTNIATLGSKSLYSDSPVDYDKLFKESEAAIGQQKIEKGITTISSKKQREDFDELISQQINGLIPTDTDKARLLTAKVGYKIYSNDEDKALALQNGGDPNKLIKFEVNSKGAWGPVLTDAQKNEALNYAKNNIVGRMSYEKTTDEPPRVTVNTGIKKPTEAKTIRNATLKTAKKAFEDILTNGPKSPALQDIKNLYKGYYENGVDVEAIVNTKTGKMMGARVFTLNDEGKRDKEIDRITSVKDMFRLFTPKDRKGQEYVDFGLATQEEEDFNNY
jgi:hypothetical protein